MSLGTYLVGASVGLIVAVYVSRPLYKQKKIDTDKIIEQWVSVARSQYGDFTQASEADIPIEVMPVTNVHKSDHDDESINFCPQCGRRVEADHRFCPGCGTSLTFGATK